MTAGSGGGPWRVLVFDRSDAADPKWIIASVTLPADVRPAAVEPDGVRYADWPEATSWVAQIVGFKPQLVPISAIVWRIDETRAR